MAASKIVLRKGGGKLGNFSSGSLQGWETRSLLVENDGMKVLQAKSADGVSEFFEKQKIDLTRTPFLSWRWRVESRLGRLSERSETGMIIRCGSM
ncbi:DUF3047 domain-containing protein [Methylomicrobium sp. RS1]|uniref:DUF3047 domain-containing protein n=1 Tax=Candidatus Methylomicrobium oryzae TaxID=2802053 RepID=UPI001F239EDD|nr:DUF3047 domain-containing protein [Methylomicrobium sp. RS1]